MFEADMRVDMLIAYYVKRNEVMVRLLRSLGFEERGFDEESNELVMKLNRSV